MNETLPAILLLDQIRPNPDQPRKDFDQDGLLNLADSIKEHGVLNPVSVRGPFGDNGSTYYTLIDGERRCRAAKLAGLEDIPALVRPILHDGDDLLLAMVGNFQRSDMNPIEEAKAYQKLMHQGFTQAEISEKVNRSVPSITIRLKLLMMEPEIQEFYARGWLPIDPGTIYQIANLPDDLRVNVARQLATRRASVTSIKHFCTRLGHRKNVRIHQTYNVQSKSPAIEISGAGQANVFKVARIDANQWPVMEKALAKTCEDCVLSDQASDVICRDCPLVEFMKKFVSLLPE